MTKRYKKLKNQSMRASQTVAATATNPETRKPQAKTRKRALLTNPNLWKPQLLCYFERRFGKRARSRSSGYVWFCWLICIDIHIDILIITTVILIITIINYNYYDDYYCFTKLETPKTPAESRRNSKATTVTLDWRNPQTEASKGRLKPM